MTLHVSACDTLKAMTEPDIAIGGNTKISDGDFWLVFEMREELCPIPAICISAEIFFSWHNVENNEAFVRNIILHHRVNITSVEGRCKFIFKRFYRCFFSL